MVGATYEDERVWVHPHADVVVDLYDGKAVFHEIRFAGPRIRSIEQG
jgi:hypothetical protein